MFQRRNEHFDVHFLRIRPVLIPSKDGKDAAYERRKVFSSRQSRHFFPVNSMIKRVFPICTLNWRVNNYDCRQGKRIIKRNENTNDIIRTYELGTVQAKLVSLHF